MLPDPPNKRAYAALIIVSFFWGTTYLVSRVAVQYIPGLYLAGLRTLVAGTVMVSFFLIRGEKFPDRKTLMQSALLGIVMVGLSGGLSHWSVQYISGGLAAIIGSTIPLWMALFSLTLNRQRKFSLQLVAGLLLGFAGIIIIFYDHLEEMLNKDFRFGIFLASFSCITWSAGSVYTSKIKLNTGILFGAGLQMLFAGIALVVVCFLTGYTVDLRELQPETWYEIIYLIIVGSLLCYSSYVYAVSHLPPARVAVYAYINPIVAIVFGWLLLHEKLNFFIGGGAAVTIFGVYLVNSSFKKPEMEKKFNVEIIDYEKKYQPDFFELNKRWIEKDFPLEEIDLLVLNNPENYILKDGGVILFARVENKIAGTCALKKTSSHVFELTKMTVDENYRGMKIGEQLGYAAIDRAKQVGAAKVELYSNRITSAIAVQLYLKLGFKEVELTPGIYKRANIKMEIEV